MWTADGTAEIEKRASPEFARLPPNRASSTAPRTPGGSSNRSQVASSEYYTAAWGSPYDGSPSPISAQYGVDGPEKDREELAEGSPGPLFGLEHLLTSRLKPQSGLTPPRPSFGGRSQSSRSYSETVTRPSALRYHTEKWVEQSGSWSSERANWLSDESAKSGSDTEGEQSVGKVKSQTYTTDIESPTQLRTNRSTVPPHDIGLKVSKGHKSRQSNLTLNQQAFWQTLRDDREGQIDEMYASKWAATPPPETDPADLEKCRSNVNNLLDKALPSPPQGEEAVNEVVGDNDRDTKTDAPEVAPSLTPEPRMKKRIPWNGKTCIVSIPRGHFNGIEHVKPMSQQDVMERLQSFENAGYDISGFDLDQSSSAGPAQIRPIYPNETESREMPRGDLIRVRIPDPKQWAAYQTWLTEQKLAALGVSTGLEEAAPTMSRQNSGTYPALPFSPPLPTNSAQSISRPGMMRSQHSHRASVASPVSPLNGPFGHMRAHSSFVSPFGFPQPQQQPIGNGVRPFSPPQHVMPNGLARVGSPAQAAMRLDLNAMRSPSSPLHQQVQPVTPQEYSRGLAEDQRRRQHVYSQSVQFQPHQNAYMPQMQGAHQTPALPELPEDEEEEEEGEVFEETYVPPHRREQFNANIAVPTPRGHRHNISEGLDREIREAEDHLENDARRVQQLDLAAAGAASRTDAMNSNAKPESAMADSKSDAVLASSGQDALSQAPFKGHKTTASRFNVAAPAFEFNPSASFKSTAPAFTFGSPHAGPGSTSSADKQQANGHSRKHSSGSLNVAAPTFQPSTVSNATPTRDFNFSSSGPSFKPDVPAFNPPVAASKTIIDQLPSIFGKVDLADIVKPSKKSKAVAIVRPEETVDKVGNNESEVEDEDGRITQSDERQKRMRFGGADGDEVPRFAEPTPLLSSGTATEDFAVQKAQIAADETPLVEEAGDEAMKQGFLVPEPTAEPQPATSNDVSHPESDASATQSSNFDPQEEKKGHKKSTSSLSALAKPFSFRPAEGLTGEPSVKITQHADVSDEEDDESAHESPFLRASPVRSRDSSTALRFDHHSPLTAPESHKHLQYASDGRIADVTQIEPSFDEIDAVMRQLNDEQSEDKHAMSVRSSPRLSDVHDNLDPPQRGRSDAPSPSPRRRQALPPLQADSSFTAREGSDSSGAIPNGWPRIRNLNKSDAAISDWSGVLSPVDEDRLQQRSHFFDSHVDKLVGSVVEKRLQPLEDALQRIQQSVSAAANRDASQLPKRSRSALESDADDEDDVLEAQRPRPISQGQEKRMDRIKTIMTEALREHSALRASERPNDDMTEVYSALADMKTSFAKAASTSLDLEDVRAVVEEVLNKQSQALVPITIDEGRESHRRQVSELEGRLDETMAGALEEANHRHAIEEREADTRRLLRLAEEEVQLLRESARDKDARLHALEQERHDLHERLETRQNTEEQLRSIEAENEAMQATLEEYRISSTKWRHEIDDANNEREALEANVSVLQSQVEEGQDARESMRRRLEKIHSDMATAAGQLASEKAIWQVRLDEQQAHCTALESKLAAETRIRAEMDDEVRSLRENTFNGADTKAVLDHLRSTNLSLEEKVLRSQSELVEQHAAAARFERDFHDAREAGRAEVHRTRMLMETDIEAANHQVNIVRADLESEIARLRSDVENIKMEADTAKARHELMLEEEADARREALRKVNNSNSVALDDARQKHEVALQSLNAQHLRSLEHALEDKQRSEAFLNERLSLSDAKLEHFQDKVLHLEERLEVAKSAAQAAVLNAQSSKAAPSAAARSGVPEKVSPQALRESILVLQEQLQERESQIDRLQTQIAAFDMDAPAKLKERDVEFNWLRELLAVRSEDLSELINTLSEPTYDRDAVRDSAIRIRANLQMEQQEKERFASGGQTLPGQALASLSNFASPKAMQLAATIGNWRKGMEGPIGSRQQAERLLSQSQSQSRSYTPSKASYSAGMPGFLSGLMTPPTSYPRRTPSPQTAVSLPPPRLHARTGSRTILASQPSRLSSQAMGKSPDLDLTGPSTPPLFRDQSYDRDAEDSHVSINGYYDDDTSTVDGHRPVPQTLEAELATDE